MSSPEVQQDNNNLLGYLGPAVMTSLQRELNTLESMYNEGDTSITGKIEEAISRYKQIW